MLQAYVFKWEKKKWQPQNTRGPFAKAAGGKYNAVIWNALFLFL